MISPQPTMPVAQARIDDLRRAADAYGAARSDIASTAPYRTRSDLPLFWSLLPPAGRSDFLDEYGTVTDAQCCAHAFSRCS